MNSPRWPNDRPARPGPARIEQLIDDNWSDAADSPRALRAALRAMTAQLEIKTEAITALRDALTAANEYAAAQQERIEDLTQEVLSAKVMA